MKSFICMILLGLTLAAHGYRDAANNNQNDAMSFVMEDDPEMAEDFEHDVTDDEFDTTEIEAENEVKIRSDAKPWFRRAVKKVGRVVRKIGKVGKKIVKKVKKFFRRRVCYHPYGCFSKSYPFNMIWNLLPESPSKVKTKFYLSTRQRKNIRINPFRLCPRTFRNRKTIVIIHGWKGHYSREKWIRWYRDLFLRRGNFNIIGVYWGGGATRGYFTSAANTRLVGAQIAHLIQRLHSRCRLSYNNVHLIGFSLGGHVAGFAGRRLREKGHLIARITGLDPAGPVFARRPRATRLDSTDARFVDVIHTSFLYFLGVKGRAGDVDFYVNGGGKQPGCKKNPPKCSHARAILLYMKTILPTCRFRACKCTRKRFSRWRLRCVRRSCVHMGYDVSRRARGRYDVKTSGRSPYCI